MLVCKFAELLRTLTAAGFLFGSGPRFWFG